ncbi:hypothetical protein NUSPORA_02285 [Nucleospora cyclopteri]
MLQVIKNMFNLVIKYIVFVLKWVYIKIILENCNLQNSKYILGIIFILISRNKLLDLGLKLIRLSVKIFTKLKDYYNSKLKYKELEVLNQNIPEEENENQALSFSSNEIPNQLDIENKELEVLNQNTNALPDKNSISDYINYNKNNDFVIEIEIY